MGYDGAWIRWWEVEQPPSLHSMVVVLLVVMLASPESDGYQMVASRSENEFSSSVISRAVAFLSRYGYLPESSSEGANLLSEEQFRKAIRSMQDFGGLRPTGRFDQDTAALMDARRCGVPDVVNSVPRRRRRYAIQGQKWPKTDLTWSVKSSSHDVSSALIAELRRAFGVWSHASALTFAEQTSRNRHPDILVSFLKGPHGDGYPFDGEGSVLAHAFFPGEGIGGDAHFDAEERWLPEESNREDDGVNLFSVAAHEIGHSLGLSHSSAPASLMFPYYRVIGDGFRLPEDDADGIRHLYGVRRDEKSESNDSSSKNSTATTPGPPSAPPETPRRPTAASPPDICNSSVDAISLIRREIFVFKGNYFWRLHANRTLRSGYPVSIDRFWYDPPRDLTSIDALYERPTDTKIVFFSGRRYWLFSANKLEAGYPRPLTSLGLPSDLDRVDAALVWGHNGKTYLFAGDKYWKLDEEEGRVELDYPRSIAAWRGVPRDLDAAFQWTDGKTYFIKNDKFWKFVDTKMRVENRPPSEIRGFWFQCPSRTLDVGPSTTVATERDPDVTRTNNKSPTFQPASYLRLLLVIHLWLV